MKMVELKDLSIAELQRRLTDEEENLANLRFQHATSQLESPVKLRTVRRDIARIKTMLQEKRRAAGAEPPAKAASAEPQQPVEVNTP
jgi:large subunit ribosomal protein L29